MNSAGSGEDLRKRLLKDLREALFCGPVRVDEAGTASNVKDITRRGGLVSPTLLFTQAPLH
jgi:hypothetical protein